MHAADRALLACWSCYLQTSLAGETAGSRTAAGGLLAQMHWQQTNAAMQYCTQLVSIAHRADH